MLEIEPGRLLTFEYIGDTDYFNESPAGLRVRGTQCTSIDAAFVHRLPDGVVELVLVEWKYTEKYGPRIVDPAKDKVRWNRYGAALSAPDSPVRTDLVDFDVLLAEPFYQLVRQQLMAWQIERDQAHVRRPCDGGARAFAGEPLLPAFNPCRTSRHARWDGRRSVDEASRVSDRYMVMDPAVFCDLTVTSGEYIARYAEVSV